MCLKLSMFLKRHGMFFEKKQYCVLEINRVNTEEKYTINIVCIFEKKWKLCLLTLHVSYRGGGGGGKICPPPVFPPPS